MRQPGAQFQALGHRGWVTGEANAQLNIFDPHGAGRLCNMEHSCRSRCRRTAAVSQQQSLPASIRKSDRILRTAAWFEKDNSVRRCNALDFPVK